MGDGGVCMEEGKGGGVRVRRSLLCKARLTHEQSSTNAESFLCVQLDSFTGTDLTHRTGTEFNADSSVSILGTKLWE